MSNPRLYKPNTVDPKEKKDKVRRANIYLNQGYTWTKIKNVLHTDKERLKRWAKLYGMELRKREKWE